MILLTSRFAVEYFFQILRSLKYNMDQLKAIKFLVIGEHTAQALDQQGVKADLIAEVETSHGLLAAIVAKYDVEGRKIFFPRSSLPNPYLKNQLEERGAKVDQVTVYQNVKPVKRDLPMEGITKVLFTSPSTVNNFLEDYKEIPGFWKILSKGPHTSQCLKEAGYMDIEEVVVS